MKIDWQILLSGIIFIVVISIISLIIIYIIPMSYEQQFFQLCVINDWNENVSFSGELSGTINCIDFWNENFKGKWQNKCSTFFWSNKVSCHDLCNIDCEFYNKENKQNLCIC